MGIQVHFIWGTPKYVLNISGPHFKNGFLATTRSSAELKFDSVKIHMYYSMDLSRWLCEGPRHIIIGSSNVNS